jgi:hypothetical protein
MSEDGKVDLGLCDVCKTNQAIGVASTSMPLSVAYCTECAARGADPEVVFHCWFDDVGTDFAKLREGVPDQATTFKDGRYVTYREWATELAKKEPLHIVSQADQPYGSVRRCCSRCGRMCWPGMKGSAIRWTDDWKAWEAAPDNCYKMPEASP